MMPGYLEGGGKACEVGTSIARARRDRKHFSLRSASVRVEERARLPPDPTPNAEGPDADCALLRLERHGRAREPSRVPYSAPGCTGPRTVRKRGPAARRDAVVPLDAMVRQAATTPTNPQSPGLRCGSWPQRAPRWRKAARAAALAAARLLSSRPQCPAQPHGSPLASGKPPAIQDAHELPRAQVAAPPPCRLMRAPTRAKTEVPHAGAPTPARSARGSQRPGAPPAAALAAPATRIISPPFARRCPPASWWAGAQRTSHRQAASRRRAPVRPTRPHRDMLAANYAGHCTCGALDDPERLLELGSRRRLRPIHARRTDADSVPAPVHQHGSPPGAGQSPSNTLPAM